MDKWYKSSLAKDDDDSLRPQSFSGFVGQENIKQALVISISAAKKYGEVLGHTLFHGPPGLGKTSLSRIIANETGAHLISSSGPALNKLQELLDVIYTIRSGSILFIDEIHRLPRIIEERLYSVMEDFYLDITGIKLQIPHFTLVGATTRMALISSPLKDRFIYVYRLDFYDLDAIKKIIIRSAKIMGIEAMTDKALEKLAHCARGTPRVANRLVKWIRDYASSQDTMKLDYKITSQALAFIGIDGSGLDEMDRKFLNILGNHDKPIGLRTISAQLGEDEDTIADIYEPYLLRLGLISRTERGRILTKKGKKLLGVANGN